MRDTQPSLERARRSLCRASAGLLIGLFVFTAFVGGASAAQPAESAATQTGQTADDCDILLDPGSDAEYDTHVRGYSGASNSYTVTLTYETDAVPCTGETANRLRAMLWDRGSL